MSTRASDRRIALRSSRTRGGHVVVGGDQIEAPGDVIEEPPGPEASEDDVAKGGFRRRLRALLHTRPLHALELNKASRGKQKYAPYDLLALQLAAIEYITDNQDPRHGVPVEQVEEELARLAGSMAPRRRSNEHREVATVVLGGLENDGEGAFTVQYRDPRDPGEWLRADVRLLTADQAPDGTIELRATPQAINLLLDVMDVDIESAERAMHFMFKFQVEHGRLRSAAETAERMRRLSQAYQEEIQQALADAARDITQVDWSGKVMDDIERAYRHVDDRLVEEAGTLDRVAESATSEPDPQKRRTLAQINDRLEECNRHHRQLHVELMNARASLLDQHKRQRIAPPPSLATVAPRADLLAPILALPLQRAEWALDRFAAGLVPALPVGLIDVGRLSDYLWRARVERPLPVRPVETIELDDEQPRPPAYTAEAVEHARRLLARQHRQTLLSDLLLEASRPEAPAGAAHLVALGALEAFMQANRSEGSDPQPEVDSWRLVPRGLTAELAGYRLDHPDYAGDELLLTMEDADARA